ncbi:MAG: 4-alpha-glucanotransferase [Phormidesmis priestleyi Ana]|uniref:4-alpha-glucanotransferase n=1 Tax=Phormidesmis priestleyi Ana TaxID=1666911 RepID=A0A0P7ZT62_9CYAN|nr:MAG: 4-alpha-glucanotransferase [Phormidesmis priestleyi Ana]
MKFERASGILLHPTSLPSPHGIGDLGASAYEFIDFMVSSGQTLWQILPLGPTGYDHSPYTMNFSAFAGNPLMVSLEKLVEEGLLKADEVSPLADVPPERVSFSKVIPHKMALLRKAFERFDGSTPEMEAFSDQQGWWLEDFVLFMALLEANEGKPWSQWEDSIARREPAAMKAKAEELKESVAFQRFVQFKFFEQWMALRRYANDNSIQIIGDVSIYVCHNSSDVWAHPQLFKLDPETLESAYIAGVPPDYFSETGQLWGNPVYDWEACKASGFEWWISRFRATLQYVDWVRVDHFRGFEAYWQVPASEETAMNGEWVKAPGEAFFETLADKLGSLPVLAEDLGIITPEVEVLRDRFNFPGMKILMFAFNGDPNNTHLPQHYPTNCIVYSGTHDNDTAIGWWNTLAPAEKQVLAQTLGYGSPDEIQEINWVLIETALASRADLAIVPLQDLLGLDGSARMNDPSKIPGNWRWRYDSSKVLTDEISDRLRTLTHQYNRR